METIIEVGGWEHDCCGPSFERNQLIELTCVDVLEPRGGGVRYRETHHELETTDHPTVISGRVVDIAIKHPDGSVEPLERLPGGRALRGFDEDDDGHLEQPWTGEPVSRDSQDYLLTVAGRRN